MCRCNLYNYLESCTITLGNINKASTGGVTDEWMSNFEEENKPNVSMTNLDEQPESWLSHIGGEVSQSDPEVSHSDPSEYTGWPL